MATTAAPYGLRPVRSADGKPYAGATSQYLIDPAGEATNLFYGQVVIIGADGYIALATGTGADLTTNSISGTTGVGGIGVFVGCEYVNSSGQTVQAQYYPSGTANGGAIKAYVVDDPNVLFRIENPSFPLAGPTKVPPIFSPLLVVIKTSGPAAVLLCVAP